MWRPSDVDAIWQGGKFSFFVFFPLAWRLECAYSSLKKVPIQGRFEKFNELEWYRWSGMVVGARALWHDH